MHFRIDNINSVRLRACCISHWRTHIRTSHDLSTFVSDFKDLRSSCVRVCVKYDWVTFPVQRSVHILYSTVSMSSLFLPCWLIFIPTVELLCSVCLKSTILMKFSKNGILFFNLAAFDSSSLLYHVINEGKRQRHPQLIPQRTCF